MLGTRLGEAGDKLRNRMLSRKGGIREEGLKIDEAALRGGAPSPGGGGHGSKGVRIAIIVAGVVAALLVVGVITVSVLARTTAFTIASIDTQATDHLSAENIARLAKVERGATLLNVDTDTIEDNLRKNPWVGSVRISREFPDRLRIEVTERKVSYVVSMASGSVAWYLGEGNVWIEPVKLDVSGNDSVVDSALAMADSLGAVLIADVPPSVSPVAGTQSTDDAIEAVMSFQEQFSSDFSSQVASYSAPSTDDISCVLKSGVEVSLGSVSNVDSKEAVVKGILDQYPGEVTYINVRVPSSPSYRRLDVSYTQAGTGATGTSTEDGSQFSNNVPDSTMLTEEEMENAAKTPMDTDTTSTTTSDSSGSDDEDGSSEVSADEGDGSDGDTSSSTDGSQSSDSSASESNPQSQDEGN